MKKMNKIPLMKLSGAGNDFVIINNLDGIVDSNNTAFVKKVCERRMSVGADGVLLVENGDGDSLDFRMRYFNADGGEAETCGNGARCISKFAYLNGIASERMRFLTNAGVYESEIVDNDVKVRMSTPTDIQLDVRLQLENSLHHVGFANSGVPHVVFLMDDLENTDVFELGQETRYHPDFAPAGTNANFIRIESPKLLSIRTYERGVEDETLACGTGSIAAAIIAAKLGKVSAPVEVKTASGAILKIHFELVAGEPRNVHLEGDARVIYVGELTADAWNY